MTGFLVGDYIDKRREEQLKISQSKNIKIQHETLKKDGEEYDKAIINNKTLDNKEQFKTASAALTPSAKDYYAQIGKTYANKNDSVEKKYLITGYTNDIGSESNNQNLSEKRAKAIGSVLAQNGVKKSNIYYQGAGSAKPRYDNNAQSGKDENARFEIIEFNSVEEIAEYATQNQSNQTYFSKANTASKQNKTIIKTPEKYKVDFGGVSSKNEILALRSEFGSEAKSGFFPTKAYADDAVMLNCVNTKYIEIPQAKALSDNKTILNTSKYKTALNASSWSGSANKHLIGIAPISVLNDGSVIENPKVYLYKDYIVGQKAKANQTISTKINTKQGSNGLLYRVYANNNDSPFSCMDIVFDNKNPKQAKGYIYYSGANGKLYEKKFDLQALKQ